MKIELGDKVKCEHSGFTGVAVAETRFINGCVQYSVLPKVDKDNKLPEEISMDEQSLVVVSKGKKVATKEEEVGGPMRRGIKQRGF